MLEKVESINEKQKKKLLRKLQSNIKSLKDKTIAVWGLTFKPKTDDLRDAPSINIVSDLIESGANVNIYDPVALDSFNKERKHRNLNSMKTSYEALKNADALMILTEWDEFRGVDFHQVKKTATAKGAGCAGTVGRDRETPLERYPDGGSGLRNGQAQGSGRYNPGSGRQGGLYSSRAYRRGTDSRQ